MPDTPVVSLKDHLESLIEANAKLVAANDQRYAEMRAADIKLSEQRFTAAKEAVEKAETASEKRFDSVNEFRGTLADQQRTLLPRAESDLQFRELYLRLDKVDERIAALFKLNAEQGGKKAGARDLWGFIVGAVGILIALLTLALRFIG